MTSKVIQVVVFFLRCEGLNVFVHKRVPREVFPLVHVQAVHLLGEEEHFADSGDLGGELVEVAVDVETELRGVGDDREREDDLVAEGRRSGFRSGRSS